MMHTLRRSKSKYGRTRRHRRKQKKMQGGGIFDAFVDTFKPLSLQDKCNKEKKEAEEACSLVPRKLSTDSKIDSDSDVPYDPHDPTAAVTEPFNSVPDPDLNESSSLPMQDYDYDDYESEASEPLKAKPLEPLEAEPPLEPMSTDSAAPMASAPSAPSASAPSAPSALSSAYLQRYSGSGGTKRKRKNKKQNRRKKMKSRKHKK